MSDGRCSTLARAVLDACRATRHHARHRRILHRRPDRRRADRHRRLVGVVDRGFVTYSNEAKMEMLGVSAATLDAHGAVSRETALEMAAGALAHSRAGIALAVTGIAGPGGGSADKPVGLVWFGVAMRLAGRAAAVAERGRLFGRRAAALAIAPARRVQTRRWRTGGLASA